MSSLSEMQSLVDNIEIFDCHEHMAGFDWGFKLEPSGKPFPPKSLPHILMNDMLFYVTSSMYSKRPNIAPSDWDVEDSAAYWKTLQPTLEDLRGTAVYTTIREGLKGLYGFEGEDITDDNWEDLNQKIYTTYQTKGVAGWMLEALKRAKVKAIVQMAHLPYLIEYWPSLEPEQRKLEQAVVKPSLILDSFIFSGFEPDRSKARERTMELLEMHPKNHAEHLAFMHEAIRRHRKAGGVALKFICAYQRVLRFEEVSDSEAARLYDKGPENLESAEMLRLQDNLVWHLVRFAREFGFPIQIHTGYSTPTQQADPENLYNLVLHKDFNDVHFYMCHAGWPNYGGLALMARSFPNVHFGFCWMPGLSPTLAMRLMDEMFDMIPANKLLMGMDCGTVESFYGTTIMTRNLVARVLASKIDSGLISRRAANTIAQRFLHDNSAALFDSCA